MRIERLRRPVHRAGVDCDESPPGKAGVQIALMELLLAHGAAIDGPDGATTG